MMEPRKRTSRYAIASLFFSIVGFFPFNLPFLPSLLGLGLALKARRDLAANARLKGKTVVNLSLVLSVLGVLLWGVALALALWGGDLLPPQPK